MSNRVGDSFDAANSPSIDGGAAFLPLLPDSSVESQQQHALPAEAINGVEEDHTTHEQSHAKQPNGKGSPLTSLPPIHGAVPSRSRPTSSRAMLRVPSYDILDAPQGSVHVAHPHHESRVTEMHAHAHGLLSDLNHLSAAEGGFDQPIGSSYQPHKFEVEETVPLQTEQARLLGMEVEMAVMHEQEQAGPSFAIELAPVAESAPVDEAFDPIPTSNESDANIPPKSHLAPYHSHLRVSVHHSPSLTDDSGNNAFLQPSPLSIPPRVAASSSESDSSDEPTEGDILAALRSSAGIGSTPEMPSSLPTSPNLTPVLTSTAPNAMRRPSSTKNLRRRNPMPPLVPLLPHERSVAAPPQTPGNVNGTFYRSDSFSKAEQSTTHKQRMSFFKNPPLSNRQSTFHQGGPRSSIIVPSTPSTVANGEKGLERQPSFDLSNNMGLMSLDMTQMKRSNQNADPSVKDHDSDSSVHKYFSCMTEAAIIHPDSTFLVYWRAIVTFFILYNAIVIPFRLAFGGMPYEVPGAQITSYLLDHLGDVILILDMIVTSRTGFMLHGVKVMDPILIRKRYYRTWFFVDLIAALPLDLFQLIPMQFIYELRINKLIRCATLWDPNMSLERLPGLNVNVRVLKLMKLPFTVFYVSHIFACIYYLTAVEEGFSQDDASWRMNEDLHHESLTFQYLRSLFWALGLMTGRDYENATPDTDVEALITFSAMLVGITGMAYVISNVAALVEGANEKVKHFQSRVSFVTRFMASHDVPIALKEQVTRFFEYLWSRNKGFDLPAVLAELPDVITTDISMFLLQDVVNRVELFSGLDPGFIPALIKKMVANVYLPGEFLTTYGDFGDSMFFLQQGEIDIIKGGINGEGDEVVLQTLKAGDRLGEYSLILATQRTASARAVGFCTVYVLYREPFEEIMQVFVKSAAVIKQRAKAHHDATLAREAALLRAQSTAADMNPSSSPNALRARVIENKQDEYDIDTIRLVLKNKDNAKEYRKKISVYAFKVDSPVTVEKSWGISKCVAGDWIVIGGESDAYTVGNAMFLDSYEPIPAGPKHMYRKKGTVLAVPVARPFRIQTAKELLTCKATDYIVQDEKLNQWFVPKQSFEETYEVCVEKVVKKKNNILDANSAVINALKGRAESSNLGYDLEKLHPRIIIPTRNFWRFWQPLMMLIFLYNAFFVPFRCAFDIHSTHPAYLFFDYFGDACMWLDIYFQFHLAFDRDGILVTDLASIKERYLKSGEFYLDIIACFPLDFFMLYTSMQPLFRVGRVLRIFTFYSISNVYLKNSPWSAWLKLLRFFFTFALFSHLESCIYWSFTYFEGFGDGVTKKWLPNEEEYRNAPLAHQYFRAQFYSFVVLTGLGKMNAPETNANVVLGLLSIVLGLIVIAFLIGEIASIVSNLDTYAVENDKRMIAMSEFMRYNKLPSGLQKRVRRFLEHQWSIQRGADPNKALNGLPPMLRLQMKMQICGDAIRRTPFFHQAADSTLLAVVSCLTFETYPPGESIFVAGQLGDKCYIINRGMVEIQVPAADNFPAVTIKTIGKGSFFGEGALLSNGRRSASAICSKSCDLLVISRKDFARIVADDSDFEQKLKRIFESRLVVIQTHQKRRKAALKRAVQGGAKPPVRVGALDRRSLFSPSSAGGLTGVSLLQKENDVLSSFKTHLPQNHLPQNQLPPLKVPPMLSHLDRHKPLNASLRGSSFTTDDIDAHAAKVDAEKARKLAAKRSSGGKSVDNTATNTPEPATARTLGSPGRSRRHVSRSFSFATTARDHMENIMLREERLGSLQPTVEEDDGAGDSSSDDDEV